MSRQIFVNLPVRDLPTPVAFFTGAHAVDAGMNAEIAGDRAGPAR